MPPPGNSKKKNKNKDKKAKKKAGGGPGGGGGGGSSSIHSLIESGNEHLAHERLEEGLEDLRRAANLAPDSADAVEAYGMALAEFGDPADAIAALKRAAQARTPRRRTLTHQPTICRFPQHTDGDGDCARLRRGRPRMSSSLL